jgi:hypothetical protein
VEGPTKVGISFLIILHNHRSEREKQRNEPTRLVKRNYEYLIAEIIKISNDDPEASIDGWQSNRRTETRRRNAAFQATEHKLKMHFSGITNFRHRVVHVQ